MSLSLLDGGEILGIDAELLAHGAEQTGADLLLAVLNGGAPAAVIEGDVRSFSGLGIEADTDAAHTSEAPDPGNELAPVHGEHKET